MRNESLVRYEIFGRMAINHFSKIYFCWDLYVLSLSLLLECVFLQPSRRNDWWRRYFCFFFRACCSGRRSSFWLFILMVRFSFHLGQKYSHSPLHLINVWWTPWTHTHKSNTRSVRSIVICADALKLDAILCFITFFHSLSLSIFWSRSSIIFR